MNRCTLPVDAIEFIKSQGYEVFMRDRADSYAMVQGDNGIAYVQFDPMAGYTVATVHKANRQSGTGYVVARHVTTLTADLLRQAIALTVPHWHRTDPPVRKFASMADYRAQGRFEAEYSAV